MQVYGDIGALEAEVGRLTASLKRSNEQVLALQGEVERLREAVSEDMCPLNDYLHLKTERDEARVAARVFYRKLLEFGMGDYLMAFKHDMPWLEEE